MKEHIFEENYKRLPHAKPDPIRFVITEKGCWNVIGRSERKGENSYTRVERNNIATKTHRYVYQQVKGAIPEGHVVRHLCHNKRCINPDHLTTGTQQENIDDNIDAGLILKGDKHGLTDLPKPVYFKIREMLSREMTYTSIGELLDVCRHIVRKIDQGTHWSVEKYEPLRYKPHEPPKAYNESIRKVTQEVYDIIMELSSENFSVKSIQEATGLSSSTIRLIRKGKHWANDIFGGK